jgi:hypothetical protein
LSHTSQDQWVMPDDLIDFIMTTLFDQPRQDSSALVRGRILYEQQRVWLLVADKYQDIRTADYDKFRKAAKSRGGGYSMELCEFLIEEVRADGDIILNYWRRVRDDTGEGGRVVVSHLPSGWEVIQQLGGWENYEYAFSAGSPK